MNLNSFMVQWVLSLIDSIWQFGCLWWLFILGKIIFPKKYSVTYAFTLLNAGLIWFLLDLTFFDPVVKISLVDPPKQVFVSLQSILFAKITYWLVALCGSLHFGILLWYLVQLVLGALELSNLKKNSSRDDKWGVAEISKSIAQSLHLKTEFSIFFSTQISSPSMAGHFKPFLIFPLPMINELTLDQLKLLLLHEYAHLLHKDYLMHLWTRIIGCIFFFNPFFRNLASALELEMECRTDEQVANSSNSSLQYIELLMFMARKENHQISLAKGLSGNGSSGMLLFRVQRMLGKKTRHSSYFSAPKSIVILMVSALSILIHFSNIPSNHRLVDLTKTSKKTVNSHDRITPIHTPLIKPSIRSIKQRNSTKSIKEYTSQQKVDEITKRLSTSLKDIQHDLKSIQWILQNPLKSDHIQPAFVSISTDSFYNESSEGNQLLKLIITGMNEDSALSIGCLQMKQFTEIDLDEFSIKLMEFKKRLDEIQGSIKYWENFKSADMPMSSMEVRLSNLNSLLEHHIASMDFWLHLALKTKQQHKKRAGKPL